MSKSIDEIRTAMNTLENHIASIIDDFPISDEDKKKGDTLLAEVDRLIDLELMKE